MDLTVTALVLLSAFLHAGWNAAIKLDGDRLAAMTMLVVGCGLLAAVSAPFVGVPATESWLFLAASLVCHFGYKIGLVYAYAHGDFAQVYPIARGAAPLMVALWATCLFGESLNGFQIAAIGAVVTGILVIALHPRYVLRDRRGTGYALLTAVFISGYTLFDGIGARRAGSAHAYVVWLFILDSFPFVLIALLLHKTQTVAVLRAKWRRGLLAGGMSFAAYWMVVWAMSRGSIPVVAALRETSIVIAAYLGVALFREPLGSRHIAAAVAVAGGVVLLRVS